jgi:hypothetical protein
MVEYYESFYNFYAWDMKLTTHLYLLPKSRMCGAVPPFLKDYHLVEACAADGEACEL